MPNTVDILPLRYWDDPALSKVCDKIEDNEFGPKLVEFGQSLLATMKSRNGIGLAAPQVGVAKRMFVMRFPGRLVPGREGCLSLPGLFEQVYRAENCILQYRIPFGSTYEIALDRWDARVAQHEADHLDGIMFFDYKDKRENYVTLEHPQPWGARMSKQLSKNVLREWEKRHERLIEEAERH